jgi:hypothetical protein
LDRTLGIAALRAADFSELDGFLKVLDSDVYSIPFAVMKNVGIPVGLVLGQSESTERFASFDEALIEHGLERERLRSLPLFSDEGSARMAPAGNFTRPVLSVSAIGSKHWDHENL